MVKGTKSFKYSKDMLLHRSQFVLGPTFIDEFTSWRKLKLNDRFCLTIHPDLNCCHLSSNNSSLTLLGYILDPLNPRANDQEIMSELLNQLNDINEFIKHTYHLGGRWILIATVNKQSILCHDAGGLRQVFHTDPERTGELWCASHPGLIANILKIQMDKKAVEFITEQKGHKKEYWWPGVVTPYKEIKHLLPNHMLDLSTGQVKRYWPDKAREEMTINDAVERISNRMVGLMESANNRFDLAICLTAGRDSRLVLAASRKIRNQLSYMTLQDLTMTPKSPDLIVAKKILSFQGLNHDIVKVSENVDSEFRGIFFENLPFAHKVWLPDAYAILSYSKLEKVAVTGSVSEVGRRAPARLSYVKKNLSAKDLSLFMKFGEDEVAIEQFQKWLDDLPDTKGYDIMDLCYWEHRVGNWLAMCQLEFDLAWQDIFTPYNCRELLLTMLSVSEDYRSMPELKLYRVITKKLWPELLNFPINPSYPTRRVDKIRSYLSKVLKFHFVSVMKGKQ